MHRKTPLWLFATLMALAGGFAYADTEVVDGITWNYTILDGEAIVQGARIIFSETEKSFGRATLVPISRGGSRSRATVSILMFLLRNSRKSAEITELVSPFTPPPRNTWPIGRFLAHSRSWTTSPYVRFRRKPSP